jgi:hypothetical protein
MDNSELRGHRYDDTRDVIILAPRGSLSGSVLLQFQNDYPNHRLWMELDPDARLGQPLGQLNDVPVYAHVKAILSRQDPNQVEALEITYITLFAYNGDYEVIPGLIRTGAHDGDIEHITARVHPQTGDLIAMWYNSHRGRDGQWVPASQVPNSSSVNNTTRHAAYIAKHGHGNYPSVGTIHRHFFLGNDKCSDQGPVWSPKTIVLLPPHHNIDTDTRIDDDNLDCSSKEEDSEVQNLRRKLYCTRSRGCSLSSEVEEVEIEVQGTTSDAAILGTTAGSNDPLPSSPVVVCTDPCEWIYFKGDWGQTAAPINQDWYHKAETPISRTALQRIFLHLWPETESIK